MHSRPVIIVTGANSGVGLGICERLLLQLSRSVPPDSLPRPELQQLCSTEAKLPPTVFDGATLILACRSLKRAETARKYLLNALDTEIAERVAVGRRDEFMQVFRRNLEIDIEELDLSVMRSVFGFAERVQKKHARITHLICNAGVAQFTGIDWPKAFIQCLTEPIVALSVPKYKLQARGEVSSDGLGFVWQCNVFGHYVLYRELQPLLQKCLTETGAPARVIWQSSLDSRSDCYDLEDWQLVNSNRPYEGSKYQVDLLAAYLQSRSAQGENDSDTPADTITDTGRVQHLLVEPGVVHTNIIQTLPWWIVPPMILSFFMARILGSRVHVWTTLKAAFAAVHLALVTALPLDAPSQPAVKGKVPVVGTANGHTNGSAPANGHGTVEDSSGSLSRPLKFHSEVTYFGHERIGVTEVEDYEEGRKSEELLAKFEHLYQEFLRVNTS